MISKENQMVEETEDNVDTFKLYEEFIKEKDGIIRISEEICNFTIEYKNNPNFSTASIKSMDDMINYKNRIIMIVSLT
jgi:hypothetical protein